MQDNNNIIDCYNKTATAYARQFVDELTHKHLDRILLKSFAEENKSRGTLVDLGCGPGQTTKFLHDCGVTDLVGTDLSPEMVVAALKINPGIHFETADMLQLKFDDGHFGSAIAFYAIVHFNLSQLETAFKEIKRVLKTDGQFLFSFHVGDKIIHLDNFLDQPVNIDFYFFKTDDIVSLLKATGFDIIDILERQPYPGAEHPGTRAYIWAKKTGPSN